SPQPVEPPRVANPEAISAVEATSAQSPPRRPLGITHPYSGRALAATSPIRPAHSPGLPFPVGFFSLTLSPRATPLRCCRYRAQCLRITWGGIFDVGGLGAVKTPPRVWAGGKLKFPNAGPFVSPGPFAGGARLSGPFSPVHFARG